MLKAVVGTENPANENQTENVGKWILISDKWKLPSPVRQDKSQNKLMSNPDWRYESTKTSRKIKGNSLNRWVLNQSYYFASISCSIQVQEKIVDYTYCSPTDPAIEAEYGTCADFVNNQNNTNDGATCDCDIAFEITTAFQVGLLPVTVL